MTQEDLLFRMTVSRCAFVPFISLMDLRAEWMFGVCTD
jgi:hypothetical protein